VVVKMSLVPLWFAAAQLQATLHTRRVIDQAVGILISRTGGTVDEEMACLPCCLAVAPPRTTRCLPSVAKGRSELDVIGGRPAALQQARGTFVGPTTDPYE
jgi:hypothetical protein